MKTNLPARVPRHPPGNLATDTAWRETLVQRRDYYRAQLVMEKMGVGDPPLREVIRARLWRAYILSTTDRFRTDVGVFSPGSQLGGMELIRRINKLLGDEDN